MPVCHTHCVVKLLSDGAQAMFADCAPARCQARTLRLLVQLHGEVDEVADVCVVALLLPQRAAVEVQEPDQMMRQPLLAVEPVPGLLAEAWASGASDLRTAPY